nr:hypothetical protein Iba_chr04aCG24330 [Ipomoea batatas]
MKLTPSLKVVQRIVKTEDAFLMKCIPECGHQTYELQGVETCWKALCCRIASFSNSSTLKASETIRVFKQKGIPSAIIHPFVMVVDSVIRDFVDSGLDPLQFKSKPSPSSQVLEGSVFVLDPIAQPSIGPVTSKAELEFVKNIFCVISKLSDYLHPFFNFRIDFFLLVRNSQNRRQTMESILDVMRLISNPSQERVLFTAQR